MRALFANPTQRILLTASLGCAMTVLDTNVVGIILPTISRELGASFADIEWVVSTYVLCFSALLLPAGSVADRYGRKRVFLCGLTLFALASLACALVPSIRALYMARAAQGIGAAFLLAPALAIIGHAFHDETRRAQAWAFWGGIMGLTMVAAPLIGGAINTLMGWRWAFAINLPACLGLALAVIGHIPESRSATPRALDLPGIATFSCAIFMLTWALITGPEHGWTSAAFLARSTGGILLFWLFIVIERRRIQPMLELSLFRRGSFVGSVTAMFAYAAAAQVMASLLPLFLQNARGMQAAAAGAAMLPFAVAMLLLPQAGRALARRLRSSTIVVLGLSVVALGNLVLAFAADAGSTPFIVIGMAVLGCGGGLLNGETQKAIMSNVPPERAGMASGISTTSRFTGVLAGFAGLGAVLAENARQAMIEGLLKLDSPHATEFVSRAMAGDIDGAARLLPQQHTAAALMVRHAYGVGFSRVFLVAALVAFCAALIMRRTSRHP
ncbi:MFS transporter [Herbaspirillum sp. alder98]|uniref:MFS transporter n=1 Tax=Herbaspirillum sp. alder98 TaxID=2913096 RepID=UPI001CD8E78F|nr:MFS transporter [Herbaspirillum sp. alder98]MCA1325073.1 MFS transporter [Herbaspirillum sp. alder98]